MSSKLACLWKKFKNKKVCIANFQKITKTLKVKLLGKKGKKLFVEEVQKCEKMYNKFSKNYKNT